MKGRESVREEQEVMVGHVEWCQLSLRRDQKGLVGECDFATEGSNEGEMNVRN